MFVLSRPAGQVAREALGAVQALEHAAAEDLVDEPRVEARQLQELSLLCKCAVGDEYMHVRVEVGGVGAEGLDRDDQRLREDFLLDRGCEQRQADDLRYPRPRKTEHSCRVGEIIEFPSTNATLDLVGQGKMPSHPRNAVWGDRKCRPRATRISKRYGENGGRAIAHETTSVVSSFAPVAENVIFNWPLTPA